MAVYLDYNSTTPIDPRVLEAMLPYFTEKFGNASSKTHAFGWVAEAAVEQARERVAKLINATPHEIIFTSGATEAINLAIKGVWEMYSTPLSLDNRARSEGWERSSGVGGEVRNHFITVSTEHKAVLDTFKYLESKGAQVTYLPVNREGLIDIDQLRNSITPSTILVSVMYANNETGVIQPIQEISKIVHEKGILFMSDATQAVGKIPVDVSPLSSGREVGGEVDLLCLSAHKMYGPKGSGALFIRRKNPRVSLLPQIHGGGHERGLRSGTLNVPGIVGLGKACEIAEKEMKADSKNISRLRDEFEKNLLALGNIFVNGLPSPEGRGKEGEGSRLLNVTNLSFRGIKADSLIAKLTDIAVATGSACTSAIAEPSHVLKAMGISDEMAYSSIRFSLGKYTTQDEIEYALDKIGKALQS
ncbi:MAG: cysteine desulfurase [Bacteroidetes bacterium]|nr:cysteine desulfurase [Bacteroidota bacterium]